MRVKTHPVIEITKGGEERFVTFFFESTPIKACTTDTIANALIANGIDIFGFTEHGHPRGFFCAIGKCSACLVEVDGIPNVRACITPVREGMKVNRQVGRGKPKW
ncbi:MAG: (2Fe-2S)-binding protein [Fervidobacterium sp.]|uniref:(2Fe-2S)-binding protein n=1 Tax=Fervidobacterium sp. TaxID=1871331 RepID=UPI0040490701